MFLTRYYFIYTLNFLNSMTLKSIFLKVLAMYIMGKNAFKHILLIYGSFKKYEWNAQVWDYSLTRRRRRPSFSNLGIFPFFFNLSSRSGPILLYIIILCWKLWKTWLLSLLINNFRFRKSFFSSSDPVSLWRKWILQWTKILLI